ncbi:hypothetical protein PRI8871_03370 [Pseudoprimorskyibacter insulae]|uniref:Uncharacterized protein n=1 Tax=Pseudoprimorskyibacter insulae TaxID=1695997 RepID=A0A2R8AZU4_9RHOB|nr:hypothetical protein PRI8871_03370 [Pseudoprimorskyibacter insulae]
MLEQVDHEVDVRADAPNAEFAQGAVHPGNRLFWRLRMGGDLDQQRVIIAGDHPARIGRAAVQTDAHTGGRAIGGDAAIVGDKVVGRIFGRHAGLQGVAVQTDIGLAGGAGGLGQRLALGDQDLRLNDVDTGDFFGDGVFHLNAGVHLDEIELAGFHIHQELDRAGAFVVHVLTDLFAKLANLGALFFGQVRRGGALDDLLVATLHRAVALEQVIDLAVAVAKDLHLDVARAEDHLFQISFAVAKGGLGLAATFQNLFLQLVRAVDRTHPATAAAPAGFQHQGIADFGGFLGDGGEIIAQNFGGGNDRHARLDRHAAGRGLVAKRAHGFGFGADKGDAIGGAGVHEIGVFRQQAIARMDRIRTAFLGNTDNLGDRQIGSNGAKTFADLIRLVRFKAVQREFVFLGINRDCPFPHLIGSPHHADGNFTTVGYEDFLETTHSAKLLVSEGLKKIRAPIQEKGAKRAFEMLLGFDANLFLKVRHAFTAGHQVGDFFAGFVTLFEVGRDRAADKHSKVVTHSQCMHDLMRDEDHSKATPLGFIDDTQNMRGLLHTECRCRLVQDQHARSEIDRAGNGKRLTLTSRQATDEAVSILDPRDPEITHFMNGDVIGLFAVKDLEWSPTYGRLDSGEKTAADRHQWERSAKLVNAGDASFLRRFRASETDWLAIHQNFAARRRVHPGHGFDQGGFSCAIVTQQAKNFAGSYRQVDFVQHVDWSEGFVDIAQFEDVFCVGHNQSSFLLVDQLVANFWNVPFIRTAASSITPMINWDRFRSMSV